MDTIVALSTPVGRGGIGVIRMSGDDALDIALRLFSSAELKNRDEIMPKYMYFGRVFARGFSDRGYMVYFKAPASYTGEDVVEFQIHGGIKIAEGVIGACADNGARAAERGEFTKRAFLNGKMALSDAEGVIDMINADSEEAVRAAYRLMTGKISAGVKRMQERLTAVISGLEAVLDYPEELEDETLPEAKTELRELIAELEKLLKQKSYCQLIKQGIDVAIVGDTNVGKSSLLNAMLGYDRAIVSDVRGTTRDTVSESLEYKGKKINFVDTAGIRESGDIIEKQGVKRAIQQVKTAKLVIRVIDATEKTTVNPALDAALADRRVITVYNKKDLIENCANDGLYVSAKTGDGIEELLDKIADRFDAERAPEGEILTSERHLAAIKTARTIIADALNNYDNTTTDCIVTELTAAWKALGEITGETVSEKIIDDIFDKFCVGK